MSFSTGVDAFGRGVCASSLLPWLCDEEEDEASVDFLPRTDAVWLPELALLAMPDGGWKSVCSDPLSTQTALPSRLNEFSDGEY